MATKLSLAAKRIGPERIDDPSRPHHLDFDLGAGNARAKLRWKLGTEDLTLAHWSQRKLRLGIAAAEEAQAGPA